MNLLEISTSLVPERDTVTVDGVAYEVATLYDLTIEQQALMLAFARKMERAGDDAGAAAEARPLLRRILGFLLLAPQEVIDRVPDYAALQILQAFTEAATATPAVKPQK